MRLMHDASSSLTEADRLMAEGRVQEALTLLDSARKEAPSPLILQKMAEAFARLNMPQAAEKVLVQGLVQFARDKTLTLSLAQYYYRIHQPEKGLSLTAPLSEEKDFLLLHAALLRAAGKEKEAESFYRDMIARGPNNAAALSNYASLLTDRNDYAAAIPLYKQALQTAPHHTHVSIQLAHTCFRAGLLKEGWHYYQARFGAGDHDPHAIVKRRTFPQDLWNGAPLKDSTLLIWNEQGAGEEILYASMYDDAKVQARNVTVECDPRLVPLFTRSFAGIDFIPRRDPVDTRLLNPRLTTQIPAGHLGIFLRDKWDVFPKKSSFLKSDPEKTNTLRARYEALKKEKGLTGSIIGLSWRSKPLRQGDPKSLSLQMLAPLLHSSPHLFVSLQYEADEKEVDEAQTQGWALYNDKDVNQKTSLDNFAAQVAALDHVVTASNTTAHMAGALGVQTSVLLPRAKGLMWHWFDESPHINVRDRSPWYPSVTLLRQEKDGDWTAPLIHAKTILGALR